MAFKAEDFASDADFQAYLKTVTEGAVSTATSELKKKVDELIGEKRKATEILKGFEGLDVAKAKQAMEFLEKNETARLIAEGKGEEVIASMTEKLRAKHSEELAQIQKKAEEAEANAGKYKSRYERSVIEGELRKAALAAGVMPDAIDDVLLRANGVFVLAEDNSVEARDAKGELVKDGDKLLTPALWVTKLPRHYWPSSTSAGINGGGAGSKLEAQIADAAARGDHTQYRALRKQQEAAKKK